MMRTNYANFWVTLSALSQLPVNCAVFSPLSLFMFDAGNWSQISGESWLKGERQIEEL